MQTCRRCKIKKEDSQMATQGKQCKACRCEYHKKYQKAIRDKYRAYNRNRSKHRLANDVKNLTDRYIKSTLSHQNIKKITPEVIEEKRLIIKIKRKINEIRKANTSRGC
jgi:hypothetical protein